MAVAQPAFLESILSLPSPKPVEPSVTFVGELRDIQAPNKNGSPVETLTGQVFPTLLPCIESLLHMIKRDEEYNRNKLNAVNWMVEFLWKNNPKHANRSEMELLDIPFVQKILAKRPQAPLPLHLRLTKCQAATIIQAGIRGYKARQIEDVQEFREKIKRKQAAAIVIQSAWRGHKVRVNLEDADLSNRDICHWYQVKTNKEEEGEAVEEAGTPAQ